MPPTPLKASKRQNVVHDGTNPDDIGPTPTRLVFGESLECPLPVSVDFETHQEEMRCIRPLVLAETISAICLLGIDRMQSCSKPMFYTLLTKRIGIEKTISAVAALTKVDIGWIIFTPTHVEFPGKLPVSEIMSTVYAQFSLTN